MTWEDILKISTKDAISDARRFAPKELEEEIKAEGAITTSTPATADLFNISYSGKKKKKKVKE
tara:strand:+ start:1005 stop:1193 length:189 start_codon:yes stop_codon:yes gene_type:complete